jgi:hypothetical protein
MNTTDRINDMELRIELASLLGWYKIEKNSKGVLTGKLPGVRSFVPLVIPDWTTDHHQVQAVEDLLGTRRLIARYILNLLVICHVVETDEGSKSRVLTEATPRQRCEAALITLRESTDKL